MEINNELNELNGALCEVRKAYRLIASYQRRLLDMAMIIQDKFEYKIYHYCGSTHDVNIGGANGRFPTNRWSLDMLPMYQGLVMLYLPIKAGNHPKKDEWMLAIKFDNDSGYRRHSQNKEPNPVDFDNVATSSSQMKLCAFGVLNDNDESWAYYVYNKTAYSSDGELHIQPNTNTWSAGKSYDLATIPDKTALLEVIEDFRKFVDVKRAELENSSSATLITPAAQSLNP